MIKIYSENHPNAVAADVRRRITRPNREPFRLHTSAVAILILFALILHTHAADKTSPTHTFNISDFGAKGDGSTLDTPAINKAIEACSLVGGGQVSIPPGRYLSGTIHLRSHITLYLHAGARLIGTTNLDQYAAPGVPAFLPEAKWGKWHRALLVGEDLEDVTIAGEGVIDGNKVYDPTGEEKMRGPHTIAFVNCRGFTIRDISIKDSANYAIYFQVSDAVEVWNVTFTGGWDGVHFRGAPQRWCRNVNIIGCRFYTGDDSIAGRYWDNTMISDCIINSSCNGIRVIGPATRLVVDHCLFYGPGQQPHRSSNRTNMLAGINLQPGSWDKTEGPLDDVLLSQNTMTGVASPVTIATKGANPVGRVTVAGLTATGVYRSAISVESWAEAPITNVSFRNVSVEFNGGGKAEQETQPVKSPGVDARPLPSWGLYARNVQRISLEDVRFSLRNEDKRPVVLTEGVDRLEMDAFKFPHVPEVPEPLVKHTLGK